MHPDRSLLYQANSCMNATAIVAVQPRQVILTDPLCMLVPSRLAHAGG